METKGLTFEHDFDILIIDSRTRDKFRLVIPEDATTQELGLLSQGLFMLSIFPQGKDFKWFLDQNGMDRFLVPFIEITHNGNPDIIIKH